MREPRLMLPWARWPETDRVAWQAAVRSGDVFDDGGPAAHWSAGSKRTICFGYRRWLGHLAANDLEALGLAPGDRVTRGRVENYVAALQGSMSPTGTFDYVKHLYDAIRVLCPDGDWTWLQGVACQLERLVVPPNKRPRMVSVHRLAGLGRSLMARAETADDMKQAERAVLHRDGLIIALLAARPIRRRNLAIIEMGKNLVRNGEGYALLFSAEETKNHQPIATMIPSDLVPFLERYLKVYRLHFPGARGHQWLWASMKGGRLRGEALYDRICLHTREAFGKPVNPHLFRDCVATTIAIEDPANVRIAADLLGHASLEFTEKYYIQAQALEAGRRYQTGILAMRERLAKDRVEDAEDQSS